MKEVDTNPGKSYSVHSSAGCTVSDDSGWSKTLDAPEDYFTAHSVKVYIDDDTATVTELFKLAPYQKLRLLGVVGGNKLPNGYTRLDWLENVGWSQVFLPIYPAARDVVEVESELCFTTLAARQAELTNADPRLHWGVYDEQSFYAGIGYNYSTNTGAADTEWHVFRIVSYGPAAGFWLDGVQTYVAITTDKAYAPTGLQLWKNLSSSRRCLNRKRWLRISINGKVVMHLLPALDPTGAPCMFDTVTSTPFYNSGTGDFIAGVENQVQLNNLLRKLPDRTGQDVGTLQVRLADELQTSENLAKLDAMLAKNWEISQAA